jgi:hypothetical protein
MACSEHNCHVCCFLDEEVSRGDSHVTDHTRLQCTSSDDHTFFELGDQHGSVLVLPDFNFEEVGVLYGGLRRNETYVETTEWFSTKGWFEAASLEEYRRLGDVGSISENYV